MRHEIMFPTPLHVRGPGQSGKHSADQLAWRGTWSQIPDQFPMEAHIWSIHIVPVNGSTVTMVNPLDPGTVNDNGMPCHLERPGGYGSLWMNR